MNVQAIVATSIGGFFLLFLMIIAIVIPRPTRPQQRIFFTVLAIAAAALGALLPGAFEIKFESTTLGVVASASSALGLFLLMYVVDPLSRVTKKSGGDTVNHSTITQNVTGGSNSTNVAAARDANVRR